MLECVERYFVAVGPSAGLQLLFILAGPQLEPLILAVDSNSCSSTSGLGISCQGKPGSKYPRDRSPALGF